MPLKSIFNLKKWKKQQNNQEHSTKKFNSLKISKNLNVNLDNLKNMLDDPSDLVIREFIIRGTNHQAAIVYIDGLVDSRLVHNDILKTMLVEHDYLPESSAALFNVLQEEIISATDIQVGDTLDDVSNAIMYGKTIFYLDGVDQVLLMDTADWESRSIDEPTTETVIRGPKEGFVENVQTNMMLIRRYIRDQNLRFKDFKIGRRSKSTLFLAYIDDIIHPDLVKEVTRRLETIDMDAALESGYIEQWIEDSFLSPFPQTLNSERPDKVANALLRGKFVIILDGTPFALIAPVEIGFLMDAPEDYYERWMIGSLLRFLRYMAAFLAIFLPGIYIALVSYHQGMIPTDLAFSIAGTRETVPFNAFIEAMAMGATMELLREAGARLPTAVGQTIGIVGGLVIGEAAVQAGIVSPIMVIVVALTAIASFSIPSYSVVIAFRIIRFGLMIMGAFLGLFGLILGYIMINIHVVHLKSFGVPYTAPFSPTFWQDWKDLILRMPIPLLTKRPQHLQPIDDQSVDRRD